MQTGAESKSEISYQKSFIRFNRGRLIHSKTSQTGALATHTRGKPCKVAFEFSAEDPGPPQERERV